MIQLTLRDGRKYLCNEQDISGICEATVSQKMYGVNADIRCDGVWVEVQESVEQVMGALGEMK